MLPPREKIIIGSLMLPNAEPLRGSAFKQHQRADDDFFSRLQHFVVAVPRAG